MSGGIGVQPWMTGGAQAIIAALEAAGGAGCVRYVGGCVRNAVMGLPAADVDLATTLVPDAVMKALRKAGLRSVATGIEHGTVTALSGGAAFEVTTLRRDVETDGRRAVVAFTTDWAEDAQRRDFRLNALYADSAGDVFDPTEQGVADAQAGRVVFVGDPQTRIREDYLRILRFFRFQAWYGKEVDGAALEACRALGDQVTRCSAERISKELLKLLAAPDPRAALGLMAEAGVLRVILPEVVGLERVNALVGIAADAELRLAALLPADPTAVAAAADRLRLSNGQKDRLAAAARREPAIGCDMSAQAVRAAVYRIGARAFADRVRLAWAEGAAEDGACWRALLEVADAWAKPVLPVTGQDALAAGLAKGPAVGEALRQVETWWIEQDFPIDRDLALERLKQALRETG